MNIISFRIKDKYWKELGWRGSNNFIQISDNLYTNIQESQEVSLEEVLRLQTENKIIINELE